MELLSAYPALVAGTVVGYLAARLRWRAMPVIAVGVLVLVVLAMYQSTVPAHASEPWSGPITAPLLVLIAAVNAAGWAFGIGIGAAIDSTSRRHRVAPTEAP
jgi:MFS-type transporter involved in bile tolerance (Atg22 family)